MTLEAELIMKIHVQCEKDMEVKSDGSGYLRVIPIVGGTFEGKINGTVVPGGADWNTQRENGISHVFAKYLLKTDDGFISPLKTRVKYQMARKHLLKLRRDFKLTIIQNTHGLIQESMSAHLLLVKRKAR